MSVAVIKAKASSVGAAMSVSSSGYRPLCFSLSRLGCYGCFGLSSLATVQIMVGLANIGLGPGRPSTNPYDVSSLGAPYWLGAVYIVAGIITFLTMCRCSCLNYFSTVFNIISACFAIFGIVLYSMDLAQSSFYWMCDGFSNSDNCMYLANITQDMLIGMDITLIVLTSLQVCVNIASAILSLVGPYGKKQTYQPLVNEVLVINPAV